MTGTAIEIDETLVAHVVAVAEARVAAEEATRRHRLTVVTAEILAGHAVQNELAAVNAQRAARGSAPLSPEECEKILAAAMAALAGVHGRVVWRASSRTSGRAATTTPISTPGTRQCPTLTSPPCWPASKTHLDGAAGTRRSGRPARSRKPKQEAPVAVDRDQLRRLVGVASDRVDAEQAKRDRTGETRMSAKAREILAGHALHEELQTLNRERISRGEVPLGAAEAEEHIAAAMNEMWHQGDAVERWLADDTWDEMDMNGWDTVWVYFTDRGKQRVDPLFRSDDEMREWLQSVARRGSEVGEYRFDAEAYRLNMEIGDGCRLSALWGGRGVRGVGPRPYVCIRRHRLRDFRIADLRRLGSLSPQLADLVAASVHADLNVAVTGPTFAGKTTLARAAIHESDPDQRWYCIERTPELQLLASGHNDVVEVLAREPNSEGMGEITLAQHVRDSLTMNPGRIALGEILDPADMAALLNAMSQGDDGPWCTLHARTAEDMLRRLISLCQQVDLSQDASGSLVGWALDMIIYIGVEKRRDGTLRRFVSSVREVGDWNGHSVASTEVAAPGPDGLAVPIAQFVTSAAKRLADVGYIHRIGGGR